VFPETATNLRKKDVEIKETKAHALVHGVADNLKAGSVMTIQKFGQKMDDWLNQQGISVRPFESIENKIREVKLKRASKKRGQTS
jgi:HPt (histidine-containing phosphotransfer) domain-containing protein